MNNSKIMLEKILQHIQIKGITEKECLKSCSINTSFLTDWKNEKIKSPSVDKIIKLAVFLDIDLYELLLGIKTVSNLGEREKKLLNVFNSLSDDDKIRVSERATTLAEIAAERAAQEAEKAGAKTIKVDEKTGTPGDARLDPVEVVLQTPGRCEITYYDYPASAGTGLFLDHTKAEKICVKASPEAENADFAVPINGDSMEKFFSDGEVILVKSCPYVLEGQLGIFVLDGDVFFKEFGGDCLISYNEKYPPIMLKDFDSAVCLGRVLGKAEVIE